MDQPERTIVVRLLIFSGRPDPEWTPDPEAAQDLRERIRGALGRERIHPTGPGALGYRGFDVRGPGGEGEIPADLLVFRGVVTVQPGTRAAHWRDTTGVEQALIGQARRQNHGSLLDGVGVGRDG